MDVETFRSQAGTTATVMLVTKDKLYYANCGDSRTILVRNGVAEEITKDHKPQDPEEEKRIKNAGGFVADNRVDGTLGVARALGDWQYKYNKVDRNTPNERELPEKDWKVTAEPEIKVIDNTDDIWFFV